MPGVAITELREAVEDLARGYLWEVRIPNMPNIEDPNLASLLAETTQLPGKNITPIELFYKSGKFKIGGKIELDGTIDITFKEVKSWAMHKALIGWSEQIVKLKEGTGASDSRPITGYKRQIIMVPQDADGNDLRKIILDGCYPENVNAVDLDYSATEGVKIVCTFSYDRWWPEELT